MNIDYSLRIGIFYRDKRWAEVKFEEIYKDIADNSGSGIRRRIYEMKIELDNGTYIRFVPAYENCCGQKFNRIYYQEGIDEEVLKCRVYPTLFNPSPLPLE